MNPTRQTTTTDDGAQLAAWSAGPSDAPTFVLMHGFSLDHTTWQPIADRLTSDGNRVITVDLRGHGASTLGTAVANVDRFVADLDAVLGELDVSSAHLVGHSFGAVIALAARADLAVSSRLASVTSIAGTEQAIQNPVMRLGARLFSSRPGVWLLSKQATGRLMISTWFGKRPDTASLDSIRTLSAACARATRIAITDGTSDVDLRPSFSRPGPPTLVICGRDDKATPLAFSDSIATAIDGARLDVVDDAGHMVIIERPDIVVDRLTTFVREI